MPSNESSSLKPPTKTATGGSWNDLLTRLKLSYERGLIQMERPAAGIDFLEREQIQFEPGGRQQENDDLIMALALANWQSIEDHRELIGMPHQPPVYATQRVL